MLLTIYDKAGTKRADVAVNDSSTQSKEVQGDNVLSLSFSYYAFLPLDVNDYTDYLGERYWLTERYTPKHISASREPKVFMFTISFKTLMLSFSYKGSK